MASELFKKYYSRLAKQGFLKAFLCGLIVGFTAALICSIASLIANFNGLWISIALFAGLTLAAMPVFYFKLFRPTTKTIAKRIDGLGLEERLLTMAELEGDTSYIAMRQREDATAALKKVQPRFLKFAVSVHVLVALIAVGVLGIGMTTFSALAYSEVIDIKPPLKDYTITYVIKGEGSIIGEIEQVVKEGSNSTAVLAVPAEEWVFVKWSDGYADPYRVDVNVTGNKEIVAIFEELDPVNDEEPPEGGDPSSEPSDDPSNNNPSEGSPDQNYDDKNQVIDGETFYGDKTFDNAKQDALDSIGKDGDMDGGLKDIIGDYYDSIAK